MPLWLGLGAGCAQLAVVLDEFLEAGPGVGIGPGGGSSTGQNGPIRDDCEHTGGREVTAFPSLGRICCHPVKEPIGIGGPLCYKLDAKQFSVRDEALKSIHGKVPRHEATIPETLVSPKHNKSEKILTSVFEMKH